MAREGGAAGVPEPEPHKNRLLSVTSARWETPWRHARERSDTVTCLAGTESWRPESVADRSGQEDTFHPARNTSGAHRVQAVIHGALVRVRRLAQVQQPPNWTAAGE